jgi:hypothetical protein
MSGKMMAGEPVTAVEEQLGLNCDLGVGDFVWLEYGEARDAGGVRGLRSGYSARGRVECLNPLTIETFDEELWMVEADDGKYPDIDCGRGTPIRLTDMEVIDVDEHWPSMYQTVRKVKRYTEDLQLEGQNPVECSFHLRVFTPSDYKVVSRLIADKPWATAEVRFYLEDALSGHGNQEVTGSDEEVAELANENVESAWVDIETPE